MMVCRALCRGVFSGQKFSKLFFLFEFCWTLRVQLLHGLDFLVSDSRKMPDEINELPAVLIRYAGFVFAKRGHSREPDSIMNHPVDFAVAEVLSRRLPHVGWAWIQTFTYRRIPA